MQLEAAGQKKGPEQAEDNVRRCALSRVCRSKDELIRFVLDPDGVVVPDIKEKLPGRGARVDYLSGKCRAAGAPLTWPAWQPPRQAPGSGRSCATGASVVA